MDVWRPHFIDTSVADWEVLAAGVPEGIEVVLLDGQQNGVLQMAEWAKKSYRL